MFKLVLTFVVCSTVIFLPGCTSLPASKAVSNHVAFNLLNSANTTIGDLAGNNSSASDNQIVISSAARIMASAQVNITNPAGVAVRGSCQILISDGTSANSGFAVIGRPSVWYTTQNPAYNLAVPVIGYVDKLAGKYNVAVQCQQLAAIGATAAVLDNLITWVGSK